MVGSRLHKAQQWVLALVVRFLMFVTESAASRLDMFRQPVVAILTTPANAALLEQMAMETGNYAIVKLADDHEHVDESKLN